jgi:hypothetical protein
MRERRACIKDSMWPVLDDHGVTKIEQGLINPNVALHSAFECFIGWHDRSTFKSGW